ncbi:twin-arginine translocase TatA/TatE family subunit [Brevibacillus daliensis]|uniref:twin-arginine translocase TatA/TatE family subunit n=1 Tax=Brevibacillus daliensis TaxID=2892995 RepID=UPI001E5B5D2F|nr:twin-arginine translocase TatA/TatE family subunit [Brevibacillus daliensis]
MHIPNLTGILLLLILGLLLFGPSKLPQLGRAVGTTLKEFRLGTQGMLSDDTVTNKKDESTNKQLEDELRMKIEREVREQIRKEMDDKHGQKGMLS